MKILLVEDSDMVAKGLIYSLEQNGYDVIHKTTEKETINFLKENSVNLVILDISLPDGNGFNIYENIIKEKKIPTVFLTAKDEEDDIVRGLECGADDYVTKPFSTRELIARINKVLVKESKNSIITVSDIKFDLDKMIVYKNEKEIIFSSLELKILNLLFTNLNKVVTREEIIYKIWEWTGNDVYDNTVTVYLKRIREKLSSNIISTIKGIGYRIDEK
jgi:DNA-binding response OmpR family regulator